ncbi:pyridoxal phosphate-dependent decarboxylase family protein [Nonomuraea sp. NPDC049269]|uniref:pyridoxal phosphate-dependent decarboxylase family protein n=1 Tax=Nonomuraea sp. NPDC049269 TaxID=3364349 RepID=UPI00371AAA57
MSAPHMGPEEFRRHGHTVVDWIADYWSRREGFRVMPSVQPGDVAGRLPERAPEYGEPFSAMLADVDRLLLPGMAHWQHPGFLGFFPMTTSGPSVLGELLAAGLNAQGMTWSSNPACTELEMTVTDWLADLMGLPACFAGRGVIQDTASAGALVALTAALWRRAGLAWRDGGSGGRYTVYTSCESHCSVAKAARIAGIGDAGVRWVEVDGRTLAMRPQHLRALIDADIAQGLTPVAVIATVGTTSTTAVDPLPAIGKLCHAYDLWLHVDGAYAGVAAICPELRWINDGLQDADSYCVNAHKWLLTGFDCCVMWVADPEALTNAMNVSAGYLTEISSQARDYRDWQIPLGRRFRALKLWFVLRCYGAEGLRAHLRRGVALAQEFAGWVRADPRFEIVAPHPFGLVCFRLRADDDRNAELLARINSTGEIYLSSSQVRGRYVLRMAAGGPATDRAHMAGLWKRIQAEAGDA